MIELVFIVCLKANPAACEERTLPHLAEMGGPMACVMQAQPELAEWSNSHPAFQIAKWKCQDSRRRKIDI